MELSKTIKGDMLIVGGGVGGMQAAIVAAEAGLHVIVAEKADTRRSGCAGNGNDHFACYIPQYHGDNFEFVLGEIAGTMESDQWQDMSLLRMWLGKSFEIVRAWESYGIQMRPSGQWVFEGHTFPGQTKYFLKIKGDNIKQALTKKALDLGVTIINKMLITDLYKNSRGEICGALGLDISGDMPKATAFFAPTLLIATGLVSRLYPGVNPAFLFNTSSCPAVTGGGHAMAYRAGANLVNMEIPSPYVGPKYFQRGGRGSWIGLLSDIQGNPIGPVDTPSREYGDVLADVWPEVFRDKYLDGTGPVYMNCTRTSDADLSYMLKQFSYEGMDSVADYMDQYHLDLKKDMLEFYSYDYDLCSRGIEIDETAATSIPGLFATGNAVGNMRGSSTSAAVMGMVAAQSAAAYIRQRDGGFGKISGEDVWSGEDGRVIREKMEKRLEFFQQLLDRGVGGARWIEANGTLQSIMRDYAGSAVRSDNIFKAGLCYLGQLRERAEAELGACNAHELCRTLEVFEMMDVGEAVFLTSQNRKESRELFVRQDYPSEDPHLDHKLQTIKKDGGRVILNFRDRH